MPVWFSWWVVIWSWETPVRPEAAVSWDTRWRQNICNATSSHKRNYVFLQMDFWSSVFAESKTTNSRVLANPSLTPSIAVIPEIFLSGLWDDRNCCLSRSAWPPGGTECHLKTDIFLSLCPLMWGNCPKASRRNYLGNTNPVQWLPCVLQGQPHLLSYTYVRIQLKKIYLLFPWKRDANVFKQKTWAGRFC